MSTPHSKSRSQEYWRQWDRTYRVGFVVSVILHILVIFLFRTEITIPPLDYAAAGEEAGDFNAAAGGGMEMIAYQVVQPPPAPEEVVEPVPVEPEPEPDVPPPEDPPEEPVREPSQTTGQTSAAGQGQGQDDGPGTDRGTGQGDAGTAEAGTGQVTAPTPRGLILPPSDRPGSVRGRTVTVYVFVNPVGTVVRDSTRLNPTSGDSRFDNRLKQQAAEWRFRPATLDGQPVAAWFPYTITF